MNLSAWEKYFSGVNWRELLVYCIAAVLLLGRSLDYGHSTLSLPALPTGATVALEVFVAVVMAAMYLKYPKTAKEIAIIAERLEPGILSEAQSEADRLEQEAAARCTAAAAAAAAAEAHAEQQQQQQQQRGNGQGA